MHEIMMEGYGNMIIEHTLEDIASIIINQSVFSEDTRDAFEMA